MYYGFQKPEASRYKNTQNFEIAQVKMRLKSEALARYLGETNIVQHEQKNMILIWFNTFE